MATTKITSPQVVPQPNPIQDIYFPSDPLSFILMLPVLPIILLVQALARAGVQPQGLININNIIGQPASIEQPAPTINTSPPALSDLTSTTIIHKDNHTVTNSETFIDLKGSGKIDEITVRAPASFTIHLSIDNKPLYDKSVVDMMKNAAYVGGIIADLRDGMYIFSISGLSFANKAYMAISVDDTVVFDTIYVRLEEAV